MMHLDDPAINPRQIKPITIIIIKPHRLQLLLPKMLIMLRMSHLPQILQIGPQNGIPQMNKFAMLLVFNLDHTPRVLSSPHGFVAERVFFNGADDGKGHLGVEFFVFGGGVGVDLEGVGGELVKVYVFGWGKGSKSIRQRADATCAHKRPMPIRPQALKAQS